MKQANWKKNLIAAGVLVTVCAGIYLNWVYSGGEAKNLSDTLDAQKVMSDELLILDGSSVEVGGTVDTVSDYFSAVRLSRQKARDSAVTVLQETIATGSDQEASSSTSQLEEIVQIALCEAQIESLVIAKGYTDCVAYMSDEGISVAVSAPEGGLTDTDVALIADIVMSQSDQSYEQIHVVEVK